MNKSSSEILPPFSFCRIVDGNVQHGEIFLSHNIAWLIANRLPYNHSFTDDLQNCISNHLNGCMIDGCNENTAKFLSENGFEKIQLGKEAVLELHGNHFDKKSVKELIKRGLRDRNFEEIHYSKETVENLSLFKRECSHGKKPQLKYLFTDEFNEFNRLFVLSDETGYWQGAIMISDKDKYFAQTELILRRKNAPPGVMEALIFSVYNKLLREDYRFWSLGAVPFVSYGNHFFSKSGFINSTGRKLRFAYNYKGLYDFKNKFKPIWLDYYFCIKPKLRLSLIFSILIKTNLLNLVLYNLHLSFLIKQ
jgi:glycosyltransferase 2 family protein